jgi:hypothetical protein
MFNVEERQWRQLGGGGPDGGYVHFPEAISGRQLLVTHLFSPVFQKLMIYGLDESGTGAYSDISPK